MRGWGFGLLVRVSMDDSKLVRVKFADLSRMRACFDQLEPCRDGIGALFEGLWSEYCIG